MELTTPTQEMARPRILLGKISENSTHMPGPSENAKLATNPSMPISTSVGLVRARLRREIRTAASSMNAPMPTQPNISSGRRPTRSMSSSASTVNTTFTRPDQHGLHERRIGTGPGALENHDGIRQHGIDAGDLLQDADAAGR